MDALLNNPSRHREQVFGSGSFALPFELDRWELNRELTYLPETYYGLGYLAAVRAVDRAGVSGLYALCERAQRQERTVVPSEWLFELAELETREQWELGLERLLGRDELMQLHRLDPELLPSVLALSLRAAYGETPASDFLQRARPRIVGSDGSELGLLELPEGAERFERLW